MRNHNRYITTPKNKRDTSSKAVEDFITIVLFSENHGYRMKSYGPVSLIKIGGKTILETQIEAIKASFYNFEIIVCSGFETQKTVNFIKEKFPEVNIRVVENQVHFNTNCCESARLCLNNTSNDKILFCSGFNLLRPFHLKGLNLDFCSVITQENNSDGAFEINAISNNGSLEQQFFPFLICPGFLRSRPLFPYASVCVFAPCTVTKLLEGRCVLLPETGVGSAPGQV